jgi:hypothetical protein
LFNLQIEFNTFLYNCIFSRCFSQLKIRWYSSSLRNQLLIEDTIISHRKIIIFCFGRWGKSGWNKMCFWRFGYTATPNTKRDYVTRTSCFTRPLRNWEAGGQHTVHNNSVRSANSCLYIYSSHRLSNTVISCSLRRVRMPLSSWEVIFKYIIGGDRRQTLYPFYTP